MTDGQWLTRYIGDPIAARTLSEASGELLLIRHGQPVAREQRADADVLNPGLSMLGGEQAAALALALANEPIETVYTSSMRRAQETAAKAGLRAIARHDLREVQVVLPGWEQRLGITEESAWAAAAEAFEATGRWEAYACAESGRALRARAARALVEICRSHPNGGVAVVTHGAFMNALVATVIGAATDMFFQPGHCSISRLRVRDARYAIGSLNEMQHLPAHLRTR